MKEASVVNTILQTTGTRFASLICGCPMQRSALFAALLMISASTNSGAIDPPAKPDILWPTIKSELRKMQEDDQAMRQQFEAMLVDARNKAVEVNKEAQSAIWKRIGDHDRLNQQRVSEILDSYGWPMTSQVGQDGALTVFLVVQHADIAFQVKYLPLLQAAVVAGEPLKPQLALLEDRVLLRQGQPQRYGSQVNTRDGAVDLGIVEDEVNLDARRAKMGLEPICDYLLHFVKAHGKVVYKPCVRSESERSGR